MGDSSDSDRPLKRVKYARREELQDEFRHESKPVTILPVAMNPRPSVPTNGFPELREGLVFENPWIVPSTLPSPTHALLTLATENTNTPWVSAPPDPHAMVFEHDLSPTTAAQYQNSLDHRFPQPPRLPRLLPAVQTPVVETVSGPQDSLRQRLQLGLTLVSPFTDDRDRLGVSSGPRYVRPSSGQVNGYVKFNWPEKRLSVRSSIPEASSRITNADDDDRTGMEVMQCAPSSRNSTAVTVMGPSPASSMNVNGTQSPILMSGNQPPITPEHIWSSSSSPLQASVMPVPPHEFAQQFVNNRNEPMRIPPLFGFNATMDRMDRQLWDFYIKNWCPGRSVLSATNLWLKDFARFQEDPGIRSAIQSLAGVYIYDYVAEERVRERINRRYLEADAHFSRLLADPQSAQPGQGSDVIITMGAILSMQDIVLTEGRRKKPYRPRWLEGFLQGEYFLHVTDPGTRFWDRSNMQLDSLRLSQSIIVGRAVILAQPMTALPPANTLDPQQESSRFGWLLHPSEEEMFEIHGGCGFSLKLLHTMSQVTYLAARMMQEPRGAVTPVTARFILKELREMRQWSRESTPWNQQGEATIERFKSRPPDFVIDNDSDMTDVTAEAWRFAAIIYLQCRVQRLPRNHPEVLANLSDLAQCIRIMPTSGSQFTAQAPLLPVFFLGLLATNPDHKKVSRDWFEDVVKTPVRSSVPPLYYALTRIWNWMDAGIKIPHQPTAIPAAIGKRNPWWELLVATVHDKEEEMLCLT